MGHVFIYGTAFGMAGLDREMLAGAVIGEWVPKNMVRCLFGRRTRGRF